LLKQRNTNATIHNEIFLQATTVARGTQRQEVATRFENSIATLEEKGMNVTRKKNIDTEAFVTSVQPIWNEY